MANACNTSLIFKEGEERYALYLRLKEGGQITGDEKRRYHNPMGDSREEISISPFAPEGVARSPGTWPLGGTSTSFYSIVTKKGGG